MMTVASESLTSYSPATGEAIGSVELTNLSKLHRAVAAASDALRSDWSRVGTARAAAINAWADAVEDHASELSALVSKEMGKLRTEADFEISGAVDALRFNAGLARQLHGTAGPLSDGSIAYVEREPAGVAAFIVPWNAPILLLLRDLAPALAAGVTAVIKPAPESPLATARVIELAKDLIPDGVLNLVFGGAELGQALVEHPTVRVVAFTGSTETGRSVMRSAAVNFTRVLLELGGKSASVIFTDADADAAVSACLPNAFLIAGQFCMANSRILVERSAFESVRDLICTRVEALRVGPPDDPASDVGPLISEESLDRVMGYVDIARQAGHVAVGGRRAHVDSGAGAYMMPTVLSADLLDERITCREIFGPVVTVEPFDDEEGAIRLANITPYGLAGSVWTADGKRAWRVARGLRAGTVWVNRYGRLFAETPFGGMGHSGLGRTRGLDGLYTFTEQKHINWDVV